MKEIPNSELTESTLPPISATWDVLLIFAHTFNGYEHWGSFERCAEIASTSLENFKKLKLFPNTLTDLRTCLFFEARRWRHYGYDPGDDDMIYLHGLVEEIRKRVRHKALE